MGRKTPFHYVLFENRTPTHHRIVGLSNAAFRFWFSAICYSNEHLSDGVLHRAPCRYLPGYKSGVIEELSEAGLVEVSLENDTILVRNWSKYQRNRVEVIEQRRENAERKSKSRRQLRKNVTPQSHPSHAPVAPVQIQMQITDADPDVLSSLPSSCVASSFPDSGSPVGDGSRGPSATIPERNLLSQGEEDRKGPEEPVWWSRARAEYARRFDGKPRPQDQAELEKLFADSRLEERDIAGAIRSVRLRQEAGQKIEDLAGTIARAARRSCGDRFHEQEEQDPEWHSTCRNALQRLYGPIIPNAIERMAFDKLLKQPGIAEVDILEAILAATDRPGAAPPHVPYIATVARERRASRRELRAAQDKARHSLEFRAAGEHIGEIVKRG